MDDANKLFEEEQFPVREIDFFLNKEKVPNPTMMKDVYEYSLRQYGKRRLIVNGEEQPDPFFDPSNILNSLWEVIYKVIKYSGTPHSGHQKLQIESGESAYQYNLLIAFTLRWFGGTPIDSAREYFFQEWRNYSDFSPIGFLDWINEELAFDGFGWLDAEQVFLLLSIIESQFLHYCKEQENEELQQIAAINPIKMGKVEPLPNKADNCSEELRDFKGSLRLFKGSKFDLIRILYALYEVRFFQKSDNTIPGKKEFMEIFGTFLDVDLSDAEKVLSTLRNNTKPETNHKIFETLKSKFQLDISTKKIEG